MAVIRDIIITGLLMGGIYALIAVGLTLQYGVARVLNVAHGEFIMVGAFITWWMFVNADLNPLLSLIISGPLIFVIGFALHRTLYRSLMQSAPTLEVFEGKSMLASFGLLFVIQNLARIIWGTNIQGYSFLNSAITSAKVPVNRLVALGVVVVVAALFYYFLARTRTGKAIRAAAQDPTTAGLMGVNIYNVLAICFGLGLGMAAIAGSLLSMCYAIRTTMGLGYTVIALIVVTLGGLGSVTGALIGGVLLGLVASVVSYVQPSMTMIAYYIIFIALLLLRPKGILGR